MVDRLAYFPPKGTKYQWNPKPLNYSRWWLNFWSEWPASIDCWVDLDEGGMFCWGVNVLDFRQAKVYLTGKEENALSACKMAEKVAEEQKAILWKPWMQEALDAGWRAP